ncbi:hypothetical protein [Tsukamurella pseudospumae]|uniref:Uncharacterized protein n=1 Tax=Tsukamurella pseudospumae TaxID=239498 RepID=A0A138A7Q9_9ACTN|nr:hypothetical protein [Tsukamurella pseudospumae]KXO99190.1 hypothetical protein AXK61_18140 [Tsukamurella pseudospumae]KXP06455.1 hypothetical protein AXK60_10210 [Tsukamurella pseudospumae]
MPAQAWVTLIVGLVAAIGVVATWRQKVEADRRAEWWRRVSWAFDHVLSGDDQRVTFGWTILIRLRESRLATRDDRAVFGFLADDWIINDNEDEQAEGGYL